MTLWYKSNFTEFLGFSLKRIISNIPTANISIFRQIIFNNTFYIVHLCDFTKITLEIQIIKIVIFLADNQDNNRMFEMSLDLSNHVVF